VRSLATRRAHAALSLAVKDAVLVLRAASFDLVFVETAGIGQSDSEIVDLADLLTAMGAAITGAGTGEIVIEGGKPLHGAAHGVIPDRIEAGTYLIAGALVGDDVTVCGARPDHLEALLQQLAACGVAVAATPDGLRVASAPSLQAHDLRTSPHPGFPTDMQAQYMTLMTQAQGAALIAETVFERRFMHVGELQRMGARLLTTAETERLAAVAFTFLPKH